MAQSYASDNAKSHPDSQITFECGHQLFSKFQITSPKVERAKLSVPKKSTLYIWSLITSVRLWKAELSGLVLLGGRFRFATGCQVFIRGAQSSALPHSSP